MKLVQSNHAKIANARDGTVYASVEREGEDYAPLLLPNTAWAALGMFACYCDPCRRCIDLREYARQRSGGMIGFAMMFTAPAGFFLGVVFGRSLPEGLGLRASLSFCLVLPFYWDFRIFRIHGGNAEHRTGECALPAAAPIVLLPVAISAFSWMKAHTREGRRVTDQIEGLRQYLGVAEEERLEFLNPPEKTPELFEKFLPYAIALDVENTWAERFAGVLEAAAAAGAAASTWYSGNQDWANNPTSFASSLGDSLSQTVASASTAPGSSGGSGGSSGSSGGGSSGGGGGGGGGSVGDQRAIAFHLPLAIS